MGRKQYRRRKHIYFYIAALILLSFLGCNKIVKETTVEETEKDKHLKEVYKHRLDANLFFAKGEYENALNEYRNVLDICKKASASDQAFCPADEVLFDIGLIYGYSRNKKNDYEKSIEYFNKVIKDYPKSYFSAQAKILIGLLEENNGLPEENKRLNEQIQKSYHENKRLNEQIEKSQQENERLNQIIQKSQQIDIEIENKKKEISK